MRRKKIIKNGRGPRIRSPRINCSDVAIVVVQGGGGEAGFSATSFPGHAINSSEIARVRFSAGFIDLSRGAIVRIEGGERQFKPAGAEPVNSSVVYHVLCFLFGSMSLPCVSRTPSPPLPSSLCRRVSWQFVAYYSAKLWHRWTPTMDNDEPPAAAEFPAGISRSAGNKTQPD